ncbi:TrkH family potassium uptake protein [Fusibacter sp. JL298sf-3]
MGKRLLNGTNLNPTQVLVISFLGVIAIGTLLLMLPISSASGEATGFLNALFTSTSAVCVTGLVVVDTGTYWSMFGKTIIMLLIQIGGLGFMTMTTTVAILLGKKIGLKNRILMQEALNQFSLSGIIRLTKYVFLFTVAIESMGAVLLSFRFIPMFGPLKGIYYSIFHSISAFCNAGFDIMGGGASLTAFGDDHFVTLVAIALFVIGGMGFAVLLDFLNVKRTRKFSLHTRFVLMMTGVLLVGGWLLMFILEYNNQLTIGAFSLDHKLTSSLFLAATPRTAGFNTVDTAALTMPAKFLTIILMFIGGSPGSTAGGIKTTTFGMMFLTIIAVIKGEEDIHFMKRRISKQVINKGLAVIFISIFVVTTMIFLMSIVEPAFSLEQIIFEVFSAFGTVGLSLGITPSLSALGKFLIISLMFFGRVGPLTIVLAISSRGTRKPLIRYPEGRIIVG